jgi:DNA-binding MarR family transcriptional regulator
MRYKDLDEVLSNKIRLGIISIMMSLEQDADFTYLRDRLELTDGNLSTHIKKLEDVGYITSTKYFVNKKPRTTYTLTRKGKKAFELHIVVLEKIIKGELD